MSQQDFFIQKVQEAPENKLFRFSLSKILFDQEQFADAIPHLEKCIQLQDDWMLAHILLGKSLLHSNHRQHCGVHDSSHLPRCDDYGMQIWNFATAN